MPHTSTIQTRSIAITHVLFLPRLSQLFGASTLVACKSRRQSGQRRDAGPLCMHSARQCLQNLDDRHLWHLSSETHLDQLGLKLRPWHMCTWQHHRLNDQLVAKCTFAILCCRYGLGKAWHVCPPSTQHMNGLDTFNFLQTPLYFVSLRMVIAGLWLSVIQYKDDIVSTAVPFCTSFGPTSTCSQSALVHRIHGMFDHLRYNCPWKSLCFPAFCALWSSRWLC